MGNRSSKFYYHQKIDNGSTVPLGLYRLNKELNSKLVRECIKNRKLSPFYKGLSEPLEQISSELNSNYDDNKKKKTSNSTECPICFLYYPSNINFTRCCKHPICTECLVQIKYSLKESVPCPFCMTEDFDVNYQSPKQLQLKKKLVKFPKRKSFGITSTNIVMISK